MKRHFALLTVCLATALGACNSYSADQFKGLPHGGTPIVVGSHGYHLELVRDAEKGRFQAYVLDGHVENYVSVPEKSFDLIATIEGKEQRLTFNRAPATGSKEVAKESYTFEGTADWVKTATNFNGVVPTITLKGKTFKDVKVSFPKGSMHRAH
jgi:hypothetical protein